MNTDFTTGISVLSHGALGDGVHDDTEAFQNALLAAEKTGEHVVVPAGRYAVRELHIPAHVSLCGLASYTCDTEGGSVLLACDPNAVCLIDLTNAKGAVICGLTLRGEEIGECVHGIFAEYDKKEETTDYFHIEDVKCTGFSGDGIHLVNVNKAAIHHCMFHNNHCGVHFDGCDLQFIDNRACYNRNDGFSSGEITLSHLIGCRFDHNQTNGVNITAARGLQLHANSYEANTLCGLSLCAQPEKISEGISITGSTFSDNAAPNQPDEPNHDTQTDLPAPHGQMEIRYVNGLSVMANTCSVSDPALFTEFGFWIAHADHATVTSNAMHQAAKHAAWYDDFRTDGKIEYNIE